MARQTEFYFTGRIGNIVGYTRMGTPCLRSMPASVKQSEATKNSSAVMGKASRMGAAFRRSFQSLMPEPKDTAARNRFTGALKKWLQAKPFEQKITEGILPCITGFEFNKRSSVHDRFRIGATLYANDEKQLMLKIPPLIVRRDISAPAHTKTVSVHIGAASFDFDTCSVTGNYSDVITMDYNYDIIPEQLIPLSLVPGERSVTLVLLSMKYYTGKGIVSDLRWLPCGIVAGYVCQASANP